MIEFWDPEDLDIDVDENDDLIDVGYVRSQWTYTEADAVEQVAAAVLFRLRQLDEGGWLRRPEHPDQEVETVKRHDGMWQAKVRVIRPYVHVPLEEEP